MTVANETNFSDKAVWGGYMLSEVNVFYEQNQGIMGITATAKVRRGGRRKERKRERGEEEREKWSKICPPVVFLVVVVVVVVVRSFHETESTILTDSISFLSFRPSLLPLIIINLSQFKNRDGAGHSELLPSQGVLQPHGATASKIATFKLEHPYESITKVTLVIGVVIEALVIHTSGPDGQPMRRSPVMGHPFSGDTHRIDLAAHRPTDMVVGFVGRCNRHRLTGLGLIVRHTVERNVFSCAWTPDPEAASAALADLAVRDAAKTAKMKLGSPTVAVEAQEEGRLRPAAGENKRGPC